MSTVTKVAKSAALNQATSDANYAQLVQQAIKTNNVIVAMSAMEKMTPSARVKMAKQLQGTPNCLLNDPLGQSFLKSILKGINSKMELATVHQDKQAVPDKTALEKTQNQAIEQLQTELAAARQEKQAALAEKAKEIKDLEAQLTALQADKTANVQAIEQLQTQLSTARQYNQPVQKKPVEIAPQKAETTRPKRKLGQWREDPEWQEALKHARVLFRR